MAILARLSRVVPLIIIFALIAFVIYLVVQARHSPNRAKEVVIAFFTWTTGLASAFFGIALAYALFERNEGVADLMLCFLVVCLAGLGITRICRAVFLRHNPEYRKKRQRATKQTTFRRILDALKRRR